MDIIRQLLAHCDHTLLKPDCTWEQIQRLCDEGMRYGCASVCLPPCHVKQAAEYVSGRLRICTVIGFPNGYATTAVKVFETEDAVRNGADEIDMVINIGWVKAGRWDALLDELKAVRAACQSRILKVIIETCLLTEAEKLRLCELVTLAQADYIKTSTGFSTGGATREDVAFLHTHVGPGVKVKAAGGIRTLADGTDMLRLGADRLGASALVSLAQRSQEKQ